MNDEQLSAWANSISCRPIPRCAVRQRDRQRESRGAPAGRGFTHLSTLSDALSQPDRLQKLPHFEQLVYPQWLHDLQQGKAVTAAPAGQESD
jgi:thiosulfate/3-mercaptopyruvate sulfurtransferase